MLLYLLGSVALAAPLGQVALVDGTPEFAGCISGDREGDDTCAGKFYRFLTASLLSQGMTFEGAPVEGSAAFRRDAGISAGARLDTFPFGPPPENLSGKAENTQFSPVLPRIFGTWQGGADSPWAASLSLLPPIPVGGASALVVGLGGGRAWELGATRLSADGELGYARARAPIVASQEQYDERDTFDNPDNLDPDTYETVCASAKHGCIDTFQQLSLGLHATGTWALGPVQPYARLDLQFLGTTLYVMYDDTSWRLLALQPGLGAGLALPLGHAFLNAGADLALHGPNQSESDAVGLLWKLDGAASWRF